MPDYGYKRSTRVYDPNSKAPFKVSRSKIDMFLSCPCCFYIEARLGVKRPSMAPFTLNVAVDHLLKKEFDVHRADGTAHPLMETYGLKARPFMHEKIDEWRENFVGVQHHHKPTNLLVFGAVDDLWQDDNGNVMVVDYKATAKDGVVDKLEETKWHDQYRRQMEVYQWLVRKNDLKVSDTGYFVYVNGKKDNKAFDGKLEFDVRLIPYTGSDKWVEPTLEKLKECLDGDKIPKPADDCEYCAYRKCARDSQMEFLKANK